MRHTVLLIDEIFLRKYMETLNEAGVKKERIKCGVEVNTKTGKFCSKEPSLLATKLTILNWTKLNIRSNLVNFQWKACWLIKVL